MMLPGYKRKCLLQFQKLLINVFMISQCESHSYMREHPVHPIYHKGVFAQIPWWLHLSLLGTSTSNSTPFLHNRCVQPQMFHCQTLPDNFAVFVWCCLKEGVAVKSIHVCVCVNTSLEGVRGK